MTVSLVGVRLAFGLKLRGDHGDLLRRVVALPFHAADHVLQMAKLGLDVRPLETVAVAGEEQRGIASRRPHRSGM
ncbi:MAG: hypothetical protein F4Y86_00720 [Gammaproteobacteria bacterium]|nr:hypothetical protein [Gammaproteobacteria bacterium]